MREILFRGKTESGVWVFGDLRQYTEKSKKIFSNIMKTSFSVAPETVGQYTGLDDKDCQRIYEGDIVKVEYIGSNKGNSGIGQVVFAGCMFALIWGWHKELVCLTGFSNVTLKVIGNVHDSPELLKEV